MGVGYATPLTGQGNLTFGAGAKLSDPSAARVCLKGCDSTNTGWKVQYAKPTPAGAGNLNLDVDVHGYVTLSAGAEISLIDKSYEAGVALLSPTFKGNLNETVNIAGGA